MSHKELEDYFRTLTELYEAEEELDNLFKEKPAMKKDTVVNFAIYDDCDDLDDFPTKTLSSVSAYSGPTWIEIVEDVLKVLEASYGYPIREKVYYAVDMPIFDHNVSKAPGREVNRHIFLEMLEDNFELNNGGEHKPMDNFWNKEQD